MPLISEPQSAMKSRFGFHDHSHSSSEQPPPVMPAVKSSPDLRILKSACKERNENWEGDSAQTSFSNQSRSFEFREDPAFWKEHNVQVIIRVRPLSGSEISLYGRSQCVRQDSSQTITWIGHPESRFTFDLIADENVTQEMLFKVAGVPMVENCVEGYNSCMFAYGQTGSGKTHTMLGDIEGGTRRHSVNCGMTPRVFEYLFSRIQKEKEARREEKMRFICRCSFLEIYNEQILDLLDPSVVNLQGAANRKVASTNMNRASSRSHSVFTCVIESKWESQGVTHHRFARLNLVDLAGSERQKSSGAEGERLKEATNINKSLSTLGLVIMNLVNMSSGKSLHVPYRDSKLTFLLQDSLGGNAKTIIIANVSPSSSCSLETLSTLKFAQRAKFIKNHAVINEDASGDILAMRVQIQNLKKEVARLQSMVNVGADSYETDSRIVGLPESPAYKNDYEAALVGAFRREKDKDIAIQALTAENQAAMQLAKQREDEIQGLKMILRFRESKIKRLESVASGKISAEIHLLKEKEEHLKEIEVLRNQVDRNQEVTRFAMENLRLKEEIRRLKSFYEEGERERMNEQIMILENQLREALDWKLMHGSDMFDTQKPAPPTHTAVDEENEFLHLQAIYNQSELDVLRKKLDVSVEEKQNLERQLRDLVKELDSEKSSKAAMLEESQKVQPDPSSLANNCQLPCIGVCDQVELATMVNAIAAASQREAEAHETAISLSKENDELKVKIKGLIEDNQKLIELYEQAVVEKSSANPHDCQSSEDTAEKERLRGEVERLNHQLGEIHEENEKLMGLYENAVQEKMKREEVKCTDPQLAEMHEENEKLMGLYEKAMQERDDFKRLLSSTKKETIENKEEFPNIHLGEQNNSESGIPKEEETFEETSMIEVNVQDEYSQYSVRSYTGNDSDSDELPFCNVEETQGKELVRRKLDEAHEKLLKSTNTVSMFGALEREFLEIDELSRRMVGLEESIRAKHQGYESFMITSSELLAKKDTVEKKLSALRYSLSSFSSSIGYFELHEIQATERWNASLTHLNVKKAELAQLQASRDELMGLQTRAKQSESELRDQLDKLKRRLEEENQRLESDRVLFSIDNIGKPDVGPTVTSSQMSWHVSGKATELLKCAEEKTKTQNEIKQSQDRLATLRAEADDLNRKMAKVDGHIQYVEKEVRKCSVSAQEMENRVQTIRHEKEMVVEMMEEGKNEIRSMIAEYQQCVFEAAMKDEEMSILDEEMRMEMEEMEELKRRRDMAATRKNQLLQSCLLLEKVEEDLRDIQRSVMELNLLLLADNNAVDDLH
ncbi:unnamed protein product [Cuscuta campestris]|uniref:Kinesin motor domain-containing protein n=1 Tax=Cuscuta campestris TaxID=132261 RepID=A0A484NNH8_9ASTE|nr:unnamed protein product [Cuscuta campestris]